MKKLVIYGRLSKKREGESIYGFDAQQWDFDNYLASLGEEGVDYEILNQFMEVKSARGDFRKRPEFMKALKLCKQEGATLVVNKVDRLARDVESGSHVLNNYDVVVTVHPHADRAFLHILLVIAQQESDNTAKRTKAALDAAKRAGVLLGAASPKWQTANKDKIRVYNKGNTTKAMLFAEKYRTQMELMCSMHLSLDAMAQKMKELGNKTRMDKWYTAQSINTLIKHLKIDRKKLNTRGEVVR